ncbi:hypothetical protein D3C85_1454290 [compost metagenome]
MTCSSVFVDIRTIDGLIAMKVFLVIVLVTTALCGVVVSLDRGLEAQRQASAVSTCTAPTAAACIPHSLDWSALH